MFGLSTELIIVCLVCPQNSIVVCLVCPQNSPLFKTIWIGQENTVVCLHGEVGSLFVWSVHRTHHCLFGLHRTHRCLFGLSTELIVVCLVCPQNSPLFKTIWIGQENTVVCLHGEVGSLFVWSVHRTHHCLFGLSTELHRCLFGLSTELPPFQNHLDRPGEYCCLSPW